MSENASTQEVFYRKETAIKDLLVQEHRGLKLKSRGQLPAEGFNLQWFSYTRLREKLMLVKRELVLKNIRIWNGII